MMHSYTFPGDQEGNGFFKVYANTFVELLAKIQAAHAMRDPAPTHTMVPESPKVIARQTGYQVSGEPET